MNSLIGIYKKLPSYVSYPLMLTALVLILANLISLLPVDKFAEISNSLSDSASLLFGAALSFYIGRLVTKNTVKSCGCAFSLLVCDCVFFTFSSYRISFVFAVILSLIFSYFAKNIDLYYALPAIVLLSFTAGAISGALYYLCEYMFDAAARIFTGNGTAYGVLSSVCSLFFGNQIDERFLFSQYSSAQIINGKIVTGAVDIFLADTSNPTSVTARFLTGKYILSIFAAIGGFFSINTKLEREEQSAFALCTILSIFFGENSLFLMFILCFNPIMYFAYLFIAFLSYLVASLTDIRIGYIKNASVIELIKYGDKWLYFILIGAVTAVMTYYLFRLINTKYDFQSRKILPRDVRRLVEAIGGEGNIVRVKNGIVEVNNPNLINILKLDCEIRENEITLFTDEYELLKEYF